MLPIPTASSQGIPGAFPFFFLTIVAFPLLCWSLSLCHHTRNKSWLSHCIKLCLAFAFLIQLVFVYFYVCDAHAFFFFFFFLLWNIINNFTIILSPPPHTHTFNEKLCGILATIYQAIPLFLDYRLFQIWLDSDLT